MAFNRTTGVQILPAGSVLAVAWPKPTRAEGIKENSMQNKAKDGLSSHKSHREFTSPKTAITRFRVAN
jgi:hypothetical protein